MKLTRRRRSANRRFQGWGCVHRGAGGGCYRAYTLAWVQRGIQPCTPGDSVANIFTRCFGAQVLAWFLYGSIGDRFRVRRGSVLRSLLSGTAMVVKSKHRPRPVLLLWLGLVRWGCTCREWRKRFVVARRAVFRFGHFFCCRLICLQYFLPFLCCAVSVCLPVFFLLKLVTMVCVTHHVGRGWCAALY